MTHTRSQPPIATAFVLGDMSKHIDDFIRFSLQDGTQPGGVYYFAILASACYFESILEEFSNLWCKTKAIQDQGFTSRLVEAVASDVSRANGLEAWKKWSKVLFDVDLPNVLGERWKALHVLFQLRNQLAHGRTTKFIHYYNADNGQFLGLTIEGSSYEAPFKFLLDAGIMSVAKGEVPSAEHLLTRSVAKYFWEVVDESIKTLEQIPALSTLRDGVEAGRTR